MEPFVLRVPGRPWGLGPLLERAFGPGAGAVESLRLGPAPGRPLRRPRPGREGPLLAPGVRLAGLAPNGSLAAGERPLSAGGPWLALVPELPWPEGRLAPGLRFRSVTRAAGLVEQKIRREGGGGPPGGAPAASVGDALASLGAPLLGDLRRGGVLVAGGVRLRDRGEDEPEDWWPAEPVWCLRDGDDGGPPRFVLSRAAGRALSRGHVWVLPDEDSDDPGRFRPGSLVRLEATGPLGLARIDGLGPVAARLWERGGERARDAASLEARVASALARREGLAERSQGDVYRLVHGEADGLPGLAVDRMGPWLRLLVQAPWDEAERGRLLAALLAHAGGEHGPFQGVVEVLHTAPERPGLLCTRVIHGEPTSLPSEGRERGLRFGIEPGLDEPERPRPGFGLFPDQRENRARLAGCAARGGGRWLNLFAHTGAFSVALLAAGAEEVTSVDLSGPALDRLDENLARNGIDPGRHRRLRREGRRALLEWPETEVLAGIVLDPPTAAGAGRRSWSVERDLDGMIRGALRRLAPGGVLLVCRNDLAGRRRARGPRGLRVRVAEEAERLGVALDSVARAGPGPDFPRLASFPEGAPFDGVLARRAG